MAQDTHKFESRYLDTTRRPVSAGRGSLSRAVADHHLDGFTEPVILLQGLEDKIVPPNQAEVILESLKKRGVPVAYVPFEGEQHGFRTARKIIIRARKRNCISTRACWAFLSPNRSSRSRSTTYPTNNLK